MVESTGKIGEVLSSIDRQVSKRRMMTIGDLVGEQFCKELLKTVKETKRKKGFSIREMEVIYEETCKCGCGWAGVLGNALKRGMIWSFELGNNCN